MLRHSVNLTVSIQLIILLMLPLSICSADDSATSPVLNKGRKWRIGYYEGGPYMNYPANLRTIVAGLAELGWMAPINIPAISDETDSKSVWDYLVQNTKSRYVEFVADGYWSANWKTEKREVLKDQIIKRLNHMGSIDFMIAMGTWAGQDLSNYHHSTPTMAVSVSDPVRSGMSATAEDSGIDHFHAKCDPTRYIRQLRLFHRLVKFKRLGVVYENTPAGKTYAAFNDIQKVAKERGFEVVLCESPFSDTEIKISTEKTIQCHQKFALHTDAVFVTVHRGIDHDRMDELLAPLIENKIPTWSQRGPIEVKKGILFSISRGGFKAVGRFHAEVMARIFNGEKPRKVRQIFEDPKLIAVNTETARRVNFDIPKSILRIADEIYETVDR
jgi:ABC-type uncharacterized transport system substrate-binding protein